MSDRIDFYVGQGPSAEWIGGASGYEWFEAIVRLGCAKSEDEFRTLCTPEVFSESKFFYP